MLTLVDTGRYFAIDGSMVSNGSRLQARGRAADILRQVRLDAQVGLRGDSVAGLGPWFGTSWPATRT